MLTDFDQCYRAIQTRDARFDGWFYVGVTSTGIYCRPSCPARTPKPGNVRFFPTPAAAQAAGLRACRRCRPDAVPGSPEWDARGDVVARAMRLVRDGIVDRDGVEGLAARVGYTPRHLNRLLVAEVGAGPLALARAQRAHTARLLLETTDLPITEIAFAAGFGSVRQFNDTVREVFAMAPSEVRAKGARSPHRDVTPNGARSAAGQSSNGTPAESPALAEVIIRLPARAPYDPWSTSEFLAVRAVAGLEEIDGTTYRRVLQLPHGHGVASLTPAGDHIRCHLLLQDLRDLGAAASRCRRLLDLDADPLGVFEVLSRDSLIGPLVRRTPGLRVPGTVDPFEIAVRAVVGQQVSVASARGVLTRIVATYGRALPRAVGAVTHAFPTPEALADAEHLPMPRSRAATIRELATAVATGKLALHPGVDRAEAYRALLELKGVGPWTGSYVLLRGLGDPDAFPETDLGLKAALASLGADVRPAAVGTLVDRWRPLRSYAAQHLWHHISQGPAPAHLRAHRTARTAQTPQTPTAPTRKALR